MLKQMSSKVKKISSSEQNILLTQKKQRNAL